jgi:hypothetical protein
MIRVLIPLAVAVAAICAASGFAAGAAVCAVITVYLVSLVVHPNRVCASCGGEKRHGFAGSRNSRHCMTCKGKGEYPRWGVYLFRRNVLRDRRPGGTGGITSGRA